MGWDADLMPAMSVEYMCVSGVYVCIVMYRYLRIAVLLKI